MKNISKLVFILFILLLIIIKVRNNFSDKRIILGDISNTVIGDVNGDGKVNTYDYVLLRKYILKQITLDNAQIKRADTNGDSKINTGDYIMIRRAILYNKPISNQSTTVSVTSVSLNKSNVSLKVGESETLTATVIPTNASNKNVTWTSSNTNVVTVSNGVIRANAAGSATITVATSDGNKIASCSVTVIENKPIISKMHFLKAGDADAIIIESDGHFGLVDAANTGSEVIAKLNELGVKYLDFAIGTHFHNDHIGGMASVANQFANSNTTYYYRDVSGYAGETESSYSLNRNTVNAMKNKGAKVVEVTNQYPKFTMGDFTFELMNTEPAYADEKNPAGQIAGANKDSIVTYALYKGSIGTLLTGDIESQDERRMVAKLANKRVDVLKIPHHSWQSSMTMEFTKAMKPKIAVVTGWHLLDDISTPVYYMQQTYGTKFYVTEKSDGEVVVDYSNNLSVTPEKAVKSNYTVVETTGNWRKLQNGIWFYLDNPNDINSIVYNDWRLDGGKWYYLGIQGNMMTGWIEVNYNGQPGLYYLDKSGAMLTGWQKAQSYSPYNNNLDYYFKSWMYSDINYTINAWYQYSSTWANGKNWFYFDSSGKMLINTTTNIGGKSYTFDHNGKCIRGC